MVIGHLRLAANWLLQRLDKLNAELEELVENYNLGLDDNVNEQQTKRQLQLSQENVATELSSQDNLKDTIPLIQEKVGETPKENKTTDPEQVKNIPEGI